MRRIRDIVNIYIYLSLSNLYNYWHTVSELVPEVIAFNLAMFLLQTLRWDIISIVNPFKILSISNSCPGSFRLLHLKMWELFKISPHCVVQYSVMPQFAGSVLVRHRMENTSLCSSILRLASGHGSFLC